MQRLISDQITRYNSKCTDDKLRFFLAIKAGDKCYLIFENCRSIKNQMKCRHFKIKSLNINIGFV